MEISDFIKKVNTTPDCPLNVYELPETGTWVWQWKTRDSQGASLTQSPLLFLSPLQAVFDFLTTTGLNFVVEEIDFDAIDGSGDEDDEDDIPW